MKNMLEALKEILSIIMDGMILAIRWNKQTIKNEKRIYVKIIYIVLFMLDVMLIPLKIIIIPLGLLVSKRFRTGLANFGCEMTTDMEYDLEESKR